MKSLKSKILEELDDDNVLWKLEMFFRNKPKEQKEFNDILNKCREDLTVDKETLQEYVNKTSIKLVKLVDFVEDNMYPDLNKDYIYSFKKLIERLLDDKTVETI